MRETDSFLLKRGIEGFLASGISAGIKPKNIKDLGLIYSISPCVVAATFTTNKLKAAPVILTQRKIKKNPFVQAIVVNSGNANACTGKKGLEDAKSICEAVAKELNISSSLVLSASTGIIGIPLPLKRIKDSIPTLIKELRRDGLKDFAQAILTTDSYIKCVCKTGKISGKRFHICGIAKGAGMIMPQMATMLAFVLTDVNIEKRLLQDLVKDGVNESFNCITVDGQMSTNDMVVVLANGSIGNTCLKKVNKSSKEFYKVLFEVFQRLAYLIVRDGEGANKTINIEVKGARTEKDARCIASQIANSILVKTSFYGEQVNWGRIMAAIGSSGIFFDPGKIDIYYGNTKVVQNGLRVSIEAEKMAKKQLRRKDISLILDLKIGKAKAKIFTCDIGHDYIRINSGYS